jgi:hypothetical protein
VREPRLERGLRHRQARFDGPRSSEWPSKYASEFSFPSRDATESAQDAPRRAYKRSYELPVVPADRLLVSGAMLLTRSVPDRMWRRFFSTASAWRRPARSDLQRLLVGAEIEVEPVLDLLGLRNSAKQDVGRYAIPV